MKQAQASSQAAPTDAHKCVRSRRRWNTDYRARALFSLPPTLPLFQTPRGSSASLTRLTAVRACVHLSRVFGNQCVSLRVSWTLLKEGWRGRAWSSTCRQSQVREGGLIKTQALIFHIFEQKGNKCFFILLNIILLVSKSKPTVNLTSKVLIK